MANKNIEVTGWVDDMRDYYNRSKIFIAPMQIGTGLQNKILEAMAMQLPVITSKNVNQSIKAYNNELIECSSQEDYITAIIDLLHNPEKTIEYRSKALEFVKQNYSWKNHVAKLNQLFLSKD